RRESVRRGFALRDGRPDAGNHPRAAGRGREPRRGPALLCPALRRMDPPVAAAPWIQPPRLAPAARLRHRRVRGRRHPGPPLDPPSARRRRAGRGGPGDERAHSSRGGARLVTGIVVAAVVIGVPALAFTLWPLLRADARGRTFLPLPVDRRQQLAEEKRAALAALRELEFEHGAGHVSDADYADLRRRYEGEAAAVLTALDRLGPAEPSPAPKVEPREVRGSARRHPPAPRAGAVLPGPV